MIVNSTLQNKLCLLFLSICLFASILLQSRSFVIGFFVGLTCFILLVVREKNKPKAHHYILAVLLMLSLPLGLALLTKTGSTYGRLLIYKVSFPMFSEHWRQGVGFGNFKSQYLLYQADYFAGGKYTSEEMMLAGNTYYVFNDYWQFVIEGGVKAIFMLILVICGLSYLYLLNRRKYLMEMPDILKLAWSLLIALLLAALFTHVWEKTTYQVSVVGLIAIILYFSFIRDKKTKRKPFFAGAATAVVLILFFANIDRLVYYKANLKWQEADRYCFAGYMDEGLELFDEIYPQLKNDVIYLAMYAYQCRKNEDYEHAIRLYEEAVKIRPSNELYRQLGICYDRLGHVEKAEKSLLMAINMVPNRFIPRYELFSFYKNQDFLGKARETGKEIINLPVKVPSPRIDHIKSSVEIEIQELGYVN